LRKGIGKIHGLRSGKFDRRWENEKGETRTLRDDAYKRLRFCEVERDVKEDRA
jgi:hypothetical protein